jgi:hypothetical protein
MGTTPVITPTANPLVALYSAPPQPGGGSMHVEFAVDSPNATWKSTAEQTFQPGLSNNFLVAGMLPNTTYKMRSVRSDGRVSQPLLFTTGSLPAMLHFPTFNVLKMPDADTDLEDNMVFQILGRSTHNAANPVATDLQGRVEWYYDVQQTNLTSVDVAMLGPEPGGTVFVIGSDPYATGSNYDVLREIDLAGNTLHETNVPSVNAQLIALGHETVFGFDHDAERLPNGDTAMLANTNRIVVIDGQPVSYIGNDIIVLDPNFQVVWVWDAFDYLDVNRGPTLGETVMNGDVDWLHANSVTWSPADGDLLLSLRNQDWVIKIDYANGNGDGHVVWRLGIGGDFALVGAQDRYAWFTHQHDVSYVDDSTLVLVDNGDVRCLNDPTCDSRGQEWQLDEQALTATPLLNADLGTYSTGVGSAQRLSNGNFAFDAGRLSNGGTSGGQSIEFRPDGRVTYNLYEQEAPLYRSFRMRTLYAGVSQSVDTGDGTAPAVTPVLTGFGSAAVMVADSRGAGLPSRHVLVGDNGEAQRTSLELLAGAPAGSLLAAPFLDSRNEVPDLVPDPLSMDGGGDWLTNPLMDNAWSQGFPIA